MQHTHFNYLSTGLLPGRAASPEAPDFVEEPPPDLARLGLAKALRLRRSWARRAVARGSGGIPDSANMAPFFSASASYSPGSISSSSSCFSSSSSASVAVSSSAATFTAAVVLLLLLLLSTIYFSAAPPASACGRNGRVN